MKYGEYELEHAQHLDELLNRYLPLIGMQYNDIDSIIQEPIWFQDENKKRERVYVM